MWYIDQTTNIKILDKTIVILGNFDGIHIGHQKLLQVAKDIGKKKQLKTLVFSFYPHPTWIVGKNPKPLLMLQKEKREKVEQLGIDIHIEYPFTMALSKMSARDFITEIFLKKLNGKAVVIGEDYFFGRNKEGTVSYMKTLGEKYNFDVFVVSKVKQGDVTISSTYIRTLIANGKIKKANQLLKHFYAIEGVIVKGKQLGRTLGFPTINIIPDKKKVLPPKGVYVVMASILGQTYDGVANVGYNPTVNGKTVKIETYIFNFQDTVYGENAVIEFIQYIRPETKFHSLEELTSQISKDKEFALKYLTNDLQKNIDMI